MTNKRAKKKGKNRVGRYFFFAIIIFYIIIRFIPIVSSSSNDTCIAEYGSITVTDQLNGYILRNEEVVNSAMEGKIKYMVRQGEKVEKGYGIAELSMDTVDNATRKKLEVINQRLENLSDDEDALFQSDVEKLNLEIKDIIGNIRLNYEENNLLEIEGLKAELKNKLEKKRVISGDKSFAGKNMEDLKLEQQELENKINSSMALVKSNQSGVISYYIDGYENILKPKNIEAIEWDMINTIKEKPVDVRTDYIIQNQPLFKIIDNQYIYIVAAIDDGHLDYYKKGNTVVFNLPSGDVRGNIQKVIENKNNTFIVFMLKEYTQDLLINRKMELKTTVVNYEGLQIFTDSIVEKDGKNGVYVLDINRNAVFKPVKIIGYDDQYAIIKGNVFYEKKDGKTNAIETVKLYDEIVRNGKKVEDGQGVF